MKSLIFATWMLGGLFLLLRGGTWLVVGTASVGVRLSWSPFVMGALVMGFGTSAPELFATIQANTAGYSGLALGNIIGSNIANMALIMGFAAMVRPMATDPFIWKQSVWLLIATAVMVTLITFFGIDRWFAGGALLAMAFYVVSLMRNRQRSLPYGMQQQEDPRQHVRVLSTWGWDGVYIIGGLVALMVGADALVHGASGVARLWGVSDTLIGLTLVAMGTSLPELFSVLASFRHGEDDLIVGNILGSSFFNILAILGVAAMVSPMEAQPFLFSHGVVLFVVGWLWLFYIWRQRFSGVSLLVVYGAWLLATLYLSTGS
ncbi:MAG: sodium:calcium antiporter [Alphaproteobacteria bacterium GM202ARS2]|nr:sodium:calcium antiporter [Alphaproteobacteria bacterium GM202ARS2]